jgi:hypothetical protein
MAGSGAQAADHVVLPYRLAAVKPADHGFEATDQALAVIDTQHWSPGDDPCEAHDSGRRGAHLRPTACLAGEVDAAMAG